MKIKSLPLMLLAILLLSACSFDKVHSDAEKRVAADTVAALNSGGAPQLGSSVFVSAKQIATTGSNLNVGDVLDVNVFKVADLSAQGLTIESRGTISLPLVGAVAVAGLSIAQAEQKIVQKLTKFMQAPQVSISRTSKSIGKRVTVEGEVRTPGVFPIQGNLSFLQAIALAQGLSDVGDSRNVFFFRDGQRYPVSLDLVRDGTIADPVLKNDDRIVVMKHPGKQREKKILEYIPVLTSPFSIFN